MTFAVSGNSCGDVAIYTMSGKLVRKLTAQSGANEISWDGTNEDGQKAARGIYIYRIEESGGGIITGKLGVAR